MHALVIFHSVSEACRFLLSLPAIFSRDKTKKLTRKQMRSVEKVSNGFPIHLFQFIPRQNHCVEPSIVTKVTNYAEVVICETWTFMDVDDFLSCFKLAGSIKNLFPRQCNVPKAFNQLKIYKLAFNNPLGIV